MPEKTSGDVLIPPVKNDLLEHFQPEKVFVLLLLSQIQPYCICRGGRRSKCNLGANILGVAFREENLGSHEALSGRKWVGREGRVWASRGLMLETGEGDPEGERGWEQSESCISLGITQSNASFRGVMHRSYT